jgi:hypothetical protein
MEKLNYDLIDNIEFEGIDPNDYPDYCDAYIISADYNGREMTEDEIEELNDDSGFVYDKLMNFLY